MGRRRIKQKNKKVEKGISLKWAVLISAIAFLSITGVIVYALIDYKNNIESYLTIEQLQQLNKSAISKQNHGLIFMDIVTEIDSVQTPYAYIWSWDAGSTAHSYQFMNGSGETNNQYWYYDESSGMYVVYLYDVENAVWVRTSYEYEPFVLDILDVDLTDYELTTEISKWGSSEIPCYVATTVKAGSGEYNRIIEALYFDKETYLLIGAITYGTKENGTAQTEDVDPDEVIDILDSTVDSVTKSVQGEDTTVVRYDIKYSDVSLALWDEPTSYLNEVDYMNIIGDNGSEED